MGRSKKQRVGTKWSWGQHLVLCHGPIDAIKRIWFGEKVGWSGEADQNQTITINQPSLFGSSDQEGGVVGAVDAMLGHPTQEENDYLKAKAAQGEPISAFRYLASLVFRHVYMGNSPYPPSVGVEVERIQTGWDGGVIWQPLLANTENGLNAVHIIYELITCPEWGAGITDIDEAAFLAAAQTIKNEQFGLNVHWLKQQPVEEFIKDICRYINATVYNDEPTGSITIKLIRNDYSADTLPTLNHDHIRTVRNVKRRSMANAINTLTLTYTDPVTYQKASVVVRNAALRNIAGRTIGETVHYPMIYDASLAYQVAMRELKLLSNRIMTAEVYCDTHAGQYQPGDVVRIVYPEAGLDHVVRVQKKRRGAANNPEIRLSVVEDVFSPTFGSYTPPPASNWQPPSYEPLPIQNQLVIEAPYWWLANTYTASELSAFSPDSSVLLWLAARPSSASLGAELYYDNSNRWTFSHRADFVSTLTLAQAIDRQQTEVQILNNDIKASALPAVCQVGNELVVLTTITGTQAQLVRGVLDTHPEIHAQGATLYTLNDEAVENEFIDGEHVNLRGLTVTPSAILPEGKATTTNIDVEARATKPLPVCNVQLNDTYWPESVTRPLKISWSHRNRLAESGHPESLSGWYQDNTKEPGTTTRIRLLAEDNMELFNQVLTETELTLSSELTGQGSITIELTSISGNKGDHITFQWQADLATLK